jgi:hypothetical protein
MISASMWTAHGRHAARSRANCYFGQHAGPPRDRHDLQVGGKRWDLGTQQVANEHGCLRASAVREPLDGLGVEARQPQRRGVEIWVDKAEG